MLVKEQGRRLKLLDLPRHQWIRQYVSPATITAAIKDTPVRPNLAPMQSPAPVAPILDYNAAATTATTVIKVTNKATPSTASTTNPSTPASSISNNGPMTMSAPVTKPGPFSMFSSYLK